MDFKQASDILGRTITQADIARAAGVSHHSIRQARLADDHPGHRSPPQNWRDATCRLARERADELLRLAATLDAPAPSPGAWDRAAASTAAPAVRVTPPIRPADPARSAPPPSLPAAPATAPPAGPAREGEPSPSLTRRLLRRLMK